MWEGVREGVGVRERGRGVRIRCVEGVEVRVRSGEREGVWIGNEGGGRMIGVGIGA